MIFFETKWTHGESQGLAEAVLDHGLGEDVALANDDLVATSKVYWAISELEKSQEVRRFEPNSHSKRRRREYRKKIGKWLTEVEITEISEQMNNGTVAERIQLLRVLAETAAHSKIDLYGWRDWWWEMGADYMLKQIENGMRLTPRQAHSVLKMLLRNPPSIEELQARMEAQHAAARLVEVTPQVVQTSSSRRL